MAWVVDTINKVIYDDESPNPHTPALEPNYPKVFWYIEPNNLNNRSLIQPHTPALTPTYPKVFWYINETQSNVDNGGLHSAEPLGAFRRSSELKTIRLPRSTKELGDNTFENSGLTSVNIVNDCEYNEATTFPPGCTVIKY